MAAVDEASQAQIAEAIAESAQAESDGDFLLGVPACGLDQDECESCQ